MGLGGQRYVPAALPVGKSPSIHCIGGCRAGLDGSGEEKYSCPYRGSNTEGSSPQRIATTTTPSRLSLILLYTNYIYISTHGVILASLSDDIEALN
jgi:hypothetical protein